MDLEILDIVYNEVDTNNAVIAFSTYCALASEAGIQQTKVMSFDKDLNAFLIPK